MSRVVIAEYSKPKVLAWMLGPLVVLAILYLFLSDYPLSYVFSVENLTRSTPWRPIPFISLVATVIFLAVVIFQIITACFLGKKFVWTDGADLFVGFTKEGSLRVLAPEKATVKPGFFADRVEIPRSVGSRLVVRTELSNVSGDELVAHIAAAVNRSTEPAV